MQNGTVSGKKTEKADLIMPVIEEPPKSPRLKMKETFDLGDDSEQNGRMPLRERLAQRQKQKSNERSSTTETSVSNTTSMPGPAKVPATNEDDIAARKASVSEPGGENRRMMLRMMYGTSIDHTDQELTEEMKKMDISISERKSAMDKTKIEEEEETVKRNNEKNDMKGSVQASQNKLKKEKEEKEKEKKTEKEGFLSKVKSAISTKPAEPAAPAENKNKNARTAEDIELENRVLRSRPLVVNEYDFRDLNAEDDYDTFGPPPKASPIMTVDGVPPPAPPGFGPPPPPGMGPPPPPPPGGGPPPPPPPGGTLKTTQNRKYVRLFWQEVKPITLSQGIEKTIWGGIEAIDIDTKKLEHLFENRVKASMKRAESIDKLAKKEISVLDLKRAQAINIVLTKLPPVRAIKQAVLDMDSAVIDREGIEVCTNFLTIP